MKSSVDKTCWDGSISSSDFKTAALAFMDKWKSINNSTNLPSWSWISRPSSPFSRDEGYLCLEKVCSLMPNEEDNDWREEYRVLKEEEQEELVDDDATLAILTFLASNCKVNGGNEELHLYDFHIVYSSTYRVPVLYFRIHHSDGQPLAFEDIVRLLPTRSAEELLKSKWTFITQEEHPYLKRTWYKLHACGTSEWMKLLSLADVASYVGKNGAKLELYLISWLSVVGQAVGLKISLEMLNKFV